MAATYSGTWITKLNFLKSNLPIASQTAATDVLKAFFPSNETPISFTSGSGALALAAMGFGYVDLSISTPVTIDLTSISGSMTAWAGDSLTTKCKALWIYNAATISTNKPLIIGNASSNAFVGPLGGTTPTYTLHAGCDWGFISGESGGYTVSGSAKNLKLDPSAVAITAWLFVAG